MSKNIILASTSTLYGGGYLDYLRSELEQLFTGIRELVFIPYARPSGISHVDYTAKAAYFFSKINIHVRGIHTFADKAAALGQAEGIFAGGGNTFLLIKSLYEENLMRSLKVSIENGTPYLGCSAGTNIGGITMQTTNDMPIVYPPSYDALALVPFNINPHYLDPIKGLKHNGETRETRIVEFLSQNNIPVVGLREGSWLRVMDKAITLQGSRKARIFEKEKAPYELETGKSIML